MASAGSDSTHGPQIPAFWWLDHEPINTWTASAHAQLVVQTLGVMSTQVVPLVNGRPWKARSYADLAVSYIDLVAPACETSDEVQECLNESAAHLGESYSFLRLDVGLVFPHGSPAGIPIPLVVVAAHEPSSDDLLGLPVRLGVGRSDMHDGPFQGLPAALSAEDALLLRQAKLRGFDRVLLATSSGIVRGGIEMHVLLHRPSGWITPTAGVALTPLVLALLDAGWVNPGVFSLEEALQSSVAILTRIGTLRPVVGLEGAVPVKTDEPSIIELQERIQEMLGGTP